MPKTKRLSPELEELISKYEARYPGLRTAITRRLRELKRDYLWESEVFTVMMDIRDEQRQA